MGVRAKEHHNSTGSPHVPTLPKPVGSSDLSNQRVEMLSLRGTHTRGGLRAVKTDYQTNNKASVFIMIKL